ncbi:hypothetical protein M9H77_27329 [Catharanthus roseus]|uniref:Uncharacterized protein n=1 Tax=Catharanthus roseus TaxID=4058 RepID=A0ACC0AD73_CATRO|nr:hypothetical protein M9H77_27329 [Catharanthus roseus]
MEKIRRERNQGEARIEPTAGGSPIPTVHEQRGQSHIEGHVNSLNQRGYGNYNHHGSLGTLVQNTHQFYDGGRHTSPRGWPKKDDTPKVAFKDNLKPKFYANLQRSRTQSGENAITSRVTGKSIVFDDKLLNSILETPEDGMCFYTKNKKCFDPNLYSEKRFEEIFTEAIVLKRSEDRIVAKLDAYGRILRHIISNIVIPNVGHKSSITNMHSFVMLAMHEHRKMNFGYIAIEHMLATQSSSTKCLPYGCFITKTFQHFVINLVGVGDHIGPGEQQGSGNDDEEDNSDEEEGNELESIDDEGEDIRREMRSRKRQERTEEGQSLVDMAQIMDRIATMQAQLNDRLDDLNDKIVNIQNWVMRFEQGEKDTDEDEDKDD